MAIPVTFCILHNLKHSQGPPIIPILRRINPIPHIDTTSLRYILIVSSNLRIDLPKGLFPADVPTEILKAVLPFFHSG